MYLLSEESIGRRNDAHSVYDNRLWDDFGDFIVLIHDAKGFCDKLASALKSRGLAFKSGTVGYYNELQFEGQAGPFMKRSIFRYQEEYRFAIEADDNQNPMTDLFLGSLEEYCYGPVHKSKCKNRINKNTVEL